jgi:hypothetical protein
LGAPQRFSISLTVLAKASKVEGAFVLHRFGGGAGLRFIAAIGEDDVDLVRRQVQDRIRAESKATAGDDRDCHERGLRFCLKLNVIWGGGRRTHRGLYARPDSLTCALPFYAKRGSVAAGQRFAKEIQWFRWSASMRW